MSDENHSTACAFRHSSHPFQNGTHFVGPVHVHIVSQIRLDRVQYNELCASLMNRLFQSLVTESQLPLALIITSTREQSAPAASSLGLMVSASPSSAVW
mgnify:CR=1 FL=1